MDEIEHITQLFDRSFPSNTLEPWKCSFLPGTTHPVVDIANRYFSDKRHVQSEDIIELPRDIDPRGVLKKAAAGQYVYTSENEVKYFRKVKVEEEVKCVLCLLIFIKYRYATVPPMEFRVGDAVEVQLSFVGITISGGKYKILLVLRAITLLDTTLSKVSLIIHFIYRSLTYYKA